jgi:hypothetical protein
MTSTNALSTSGHGLSTRFSYEPPSWAKSSFDIVPKYGRLKLANLPTPLYKLAGGGLMKSSNGKNESILRKLEELDITLFVKRDDMAGGVESEFSCVASCGQGFYLTTFL